MTTEIVHCEKCRWTLTSEEAQQCEIRDCPHVKPELCWVKAGPIIAYGAGALVWVLAIKGLWDLIAH